MNAPTLPASSPTKTPRQPATTAADSPALDSVNHPVIIASNGAIEPSSITASVGDTYTVNNKFSGAAVIWDNGSASQIVGANTMTPPLPCETPGDIYYIMILTNSSTGNFVNSKINVGSGPTKPE